MSDDIIDEMTNEPNLNPVDLIVKNVELNSENQHVKEENEKLQEQIAQTEQNALELVDTIYQIQKENKENKEKKQEEKCEYNTNGSCIFHDSLVAQIKSCIELTTQLKHQVHDEFLYVSVCILLQKLENILNRG